MSHNDQPPRSSRSAQSDLSAGSGSAGGDEVPPGGATWEEFEGTLRRVAAGISGAGAGTPATVLLTGESGTGKTRAARRLHGLSSRADGPFVTAHLAGLAETLLEAELFGHVEGAFTGASGEREGRFLRADGGFIVLEAIETLALPLQVKLLRVLQERVVEPLGAMRAVSVDCAVVATTAVDLRAEVDAGRFREDLYFRLAVVPVQVPPLRSRARGEGFDRLCDELMRAVVGRAQVQARPLSEAARELLRDHPWPGNIRELENALERVLVLPGEGAVQAEELSFLAESTRGRSHEVAREALAAGITLEMLERALIEEAMGQTRGNASAAARALGLSRRAFDYRRKKLTE